jgi:hypothetical protein
MKKKKKKNVCVSGLRSQVSVPGTLVYQRFVSSPSSYTRILNNPSHHPYDVKIEIIEMKGERERERSRPTSGWQSAGPKRMKLVLALCKCRYRVSAGSLHTTLSSNTEETVRTGSSLLVGVICEATCLHAIKHSLTPIPDV